MLHWLATAWDGLLAMWAVAIGFALVLFICHLAECWLTARTTKADRALLEDPRVLAPVARRLELVRGDVKRRTTRARSGPALGIQRRQSGRRRSPNLHGHLGIR